MDVKAGVSKRKSHVLLFWISISMSAERFRPYAAVYLILVRDENVLLARRFNTGWNDGKYSLIAGHLDGGESVTMAIIREAKEESDIELSSEDLQVVHTMHRNSEDREYVDFYLVAKKWKGEPKIMETDKCDELAWFPFNDLPTNIIPCVRDALLAYRKGVTFSEWGW